MGKTVRMFACRVTRKRVSQNATPPCQSRRKPKGLCTADRQNFVAGVASTFQLSLPSWQTWLKLAAHHDDPLVPQAHPLWVPSGSVQLPWGDYSYVKINKMWRSCKLNVDDGEGELRSIETEIFWTTRHCE